MLELAVVKGDQVEPLLQKTARLNRFAMDISLTSTGVGRGGLRGSTPTPRGSLAGEMLQQRGLLDTGSPV